MPDAHKNFSYSTVAVAPITATAGTALTVQSGDGAKFPTPPFNATVWITGANPLTTNAEIVRVTAIVTDVLTIVRAQESSTARTIVVGDQIAATITAKTLTDVEGDIALKANIASPTLTGVPAAPTAAVSNNSTQIATTAYADNASGSPTIKTYQALGSAILAETVGLSIFDLKQATNLFNGLNFVPVYLQKSGTITGVKWFQDTAGAYTATAYNGVGLYSYSGGTLTLVASSTDDGNIWKTTSNTWGSKAFSSTYAAAAQLYFVCLSHNRSASTTVARLGSTAGVANQAVHTMDFTNSARLIGIDNPVTSLPSTKAMSVITSTFGDNNFYVALY